MSLIILQDAGITARALKVLDLGTGTALIPIELLQHSQTIGPIFACDLSLEMLKLAAKHLSALPLGNQIIPVFCDAKKLPIPDDSVDLIISNSIVHHIPEPIAIFHEMRRCVSQNGAVFVRDLLRPESAQAAEHLVQTYCGQENPHQQKMFRESLHAALTIDEVRNLTEEAGCKSAVVTQTTDRHWTLTWTRRSG